MIQFLTYHFVMGSALLPMLTNALMIDYTIVLHYTMVNNIICDIIMAGMDVVGWQQQSVNK